MLLLLSAKDRDIIFIDEIHEMKRDYQTALYLALDKQRIFIKTGNGAPQGIPVGNFSLLLATTDEYSILQPLRDRMKLLLRLRILFRRRTGPGTSTSQQGTWLDGR